MSIPITSPEMQSADALLKRYQNAKYPHELEHFVDSHDDEDKWLLLNANYHTNGRMLVHQVIAHLDEWQVSIMKIDEDEIQQVNFVTHEALDALIVARLRYLAAHPYKEDGTREQCS